MVRGNVAILHPFLSILGGGEFLSLITARTLKEMGYDVVMYTLTEVDRDKICLLGGFERFDIPIKLIRVEGLGNLKEVLWGPRAKSRKLLLSLRLSEMMDDIMKEHDLVFDTQGDLIVPSDVRYIHYPWLAPLPGNDGDVLYKILYKIYGSKIYRMIRNAKTLTNSTWTAAILKRVYNIFADVVYPPVKVRDIAEKCRHYQKEPDLVITISRFAPDKRLDSIIRIAKYNPNLRFVIMGTISVNDRHILESLKKLREELNVYNVEFKPNIPRDELVATLCRASIYLHPMYAEHFGISIVEAMAAGTVPVVYRDGGAWHDIVSLIDGRLGYGSIEEAADIIRMLRRDLDLREHLRKRARRIARKFDVEAFSKRIVEIVDTVYKIKKFSQYVLT